jgi:ribosomal protein S18 acetylase RimI-like enzyme
MSTHPAPGDPITTRIVRSVDDELLLAVARLTPHVGDTVSRPGRWELEQIFADGSTVLLVAEAADVIVGMLAIVMFRSPTGFHARIEDLVVDDYFGLSGVEEQLIKRAMRTSASRGASTLDAECLSTRKPLGALYERLGFARRQTNAYRYKVSG